MNKPLYICGDVHGDYSAINRWNSTVENSILIQVGDWGIFPNPDSELKSVKLGEHLKKRNNKIYAIRGNHDDPSFFDNRVYGNLIFLKDNTILNINSRRIFLCGGAISLDRKFRTRGKSYWKDEPCVWNGEAPQVDAIITHAAGTWKNLTKDRIRPYLNEDNTLESDLDKEEKVFNEMAAAFKKNNESFVWYHGHYHLSQKIKQDGYEFIFLNIDEIQEMKFIDKKNKEKIIPNLSDLL